MKIRAGLILFLLCLLPLSAWATPEAAVLGLEVPYPTVGEATQVLISHPTHPDLTTFEVKVTYRPNSSTASTETLSTPSADGRVSWTPRKAGIANLEAVAGKTKLKKSVSVRFGHFPLAGLSIFILAAGILFGGLGWLIKLNTGSDTPSV